MEGVELPGVAAGWADSAGIARSGGRDRRGSRRCSAACSPERWGEPVLWLTGLESTRGRVAGTEGSAGAGARSRGRGSFGSEDSWHDPEDRPSAVGGHQATGSPGHVMKLRSARRPCCTFEPLRSTRAARTMTRTQMARRSAEARRDTDLQPRVRPDPRRSRHSCDAVASSTLPASRSGCRLRPAGIAV